MKNMIIGILLDLIKVSIVAAGVSYFVVKRYIPEIKPQVMVVRTTDVQKGITDLRNPDQQKLLAERSLRLKQLIVDATDRGIVVVDADAVLRAPDDAFLTLPDLPNLPPIPPMRPDSQAERPAAPQMGAAPQAQGQQRPSLPFLPNQQPD